MTDRLRAATDRVVSAQEARDYLDRPLSDSEREDVLAPIRWFRRRYGHTGPRVPTSGTETVVAGTSRDTSPFESAGRRPWSARGFNSAKVSQHGRACTGALDTPLTTADPRLVGR